MLNFTPPQHVSAALAHLRHGVTACAVIVLICVVVQMLVLGFVHFTSIRFASENEAPPAPLVVTQPGSAAGGTAAWREMSVPSSTRNRYTPEPVEFPQRLTGWDAGLHVVSNMAVMGGVAGCFVLVIMTGLGVVIAGGASVPGVQRAVSACTWAMLLAAACVPWREFFDSVPFPGVFGSYDTMTALSAAADGGAQGAGIMLFTCYLVMPVAALVGAMLVLSRFRAGVEEGIIVTSVSELDERLEREMDGIRSRGVSAGAGGTARAIGALNQAIGDKPAAPQLTLTEGAAAPVAATGTDGKPSSGVRNWLSQRRIGQTNPGDPLQRPI